MPFKSSLCDLSQGLCWPLRRILPPQGLEGQEEPLVDLQFLHECSPSEVRQALP